MRIGFIGCGNMGGAIIKSMASLTDEHEILIVGKSQERAKKLAELDGVNIADKERIASECNFIFLGVKPQNMEEVLSEVKDVLAKRKDRFVLVTMAAGLTMQRIKDLSVECPVIRIMPNLPVATGEGMTLYCHDGVSEDMLKVFLDIMKPSGSMCLIDEKLIDAGCAVSGCGPAFAFMFAKSLADGGVECGLSREDANLLAAQMMLGSAKMLLESDKDPEELKDAVCSPGGATLMGVKELDENGFREVTAKAVVSAYKRTLELKKQ